MNRIGRTLASLTGAMALVIAGAGVAQAGLSQVSDDFEVAPATSWQVYTLGSGAGGFDYNIGTARGGRGNGWLHSGYSSSAASALGTWASGGTSGSSQCRALVYVNPLNDRSREIAVEVFDSAGTRIAHGDRSLAYIGYQPVQLDFWISGYRSMYVRYLLQDSGRGFDGEWTRLDDFQLTCTWP